jgi:hypothetical protein
VIENIAYGKDRLQQQIARLKYQLIAIDYNTQLIGTSTFGMLELSKPLLNDRLQLQVKTSLTSPSSR